jgi:hypothetical protein
MTEKRIVASALAVLVLAMIHVIFPSLEKAFAKHRKLLLPFCGGTAIGYVFLYMLPKLSDYTAYIIKNSAGGWEFLYYRAYLFALAGLLTYLIINRLNVLNLLQARRTQIIHAVGFCFYNIILGYIISDPPRSGIMIYVLGTFALGAHFIGVDHQIRRWHDSAYDLYLRWLLSFSVLAGWGLGIFIRLPKEVLVSVTAFLTGGILINVMTEELPAESEDRLGPFLAGVIIFVLIALIVRSLPRVYG